jgi:RNA polymerase sigma factor (sigma-70 family)
MASVIEICKKGIGCPDRGELAECSDADLLTMVQSQPLRSSTQQDACAVLIERYQGLVRSCALRYKDSPEPIEELMQVGYVGLLKAINNFDAAIGGSLAAYAQPCISGEIKRHFRDKRPAALARRLRELLASPMRLAAFGIAAADRARSRYSWERIATETTIVYEKAIAKTPPATPLKVAAAPSQPAGIAA